MITHTRTLSHLSYIDHTIQRHYIFIIGAACQAYNRTLIPASHLSCKGVGVSKKKVGNENSAGYRGISSVLVKEKESEKVVKKYKE